MKNKVTSIFLNLFQRRQTSSNSQSLGLSSQVAGANNTIGGMSSATYVKQSQQLQEAKSHHTIKQTQNSSGIALTTQRKHLKLSIDGSDSSFNNMTIKSADKNNSLVRTIPLSTKNGGLLSSTSKDSNNQMTPSSNNGIYQSHFSANSRFTTTRPVFYFALIIIRKIRRSTAVV